MAIRVKKDKHSTHDDGYHHDHVYSQKPQIHNSVSIFNYKVEQDSEYILTLGDIENIENTLKKIKQIFEIYIDANNEYKVVNLNNIDNLLAVGSLFFFTLSIMLAKFTNNPPVFITEAFLVAVVLSIASFSFAFFKSSNYFNRHKNKVGKIKNILKGIVIDDSDILSKSGIFSPKYKNFWIMQMNDYFNKTDNEKFYIKGDYFYSKTVSNIIEKRYGEEDINMFILSCLVESDELLFQNIEGYLNEYKNK
jgi:hypothetical protein